MKHYLDKNQIERLASNKAVYSHGQALFAGGAAGELDFLTDEQGTLITAEVREGEKTHIVSARFDTGGLIRRYTCSCDSFGVWRGGCSHVVAAFLTIFERNRQAAAISRASRASRALLDTFEKRAFDSIDKKLSEDVKPVNPVVLRPNLYLESGVPEIHLTIGHKEGRRYKVKDVFALLIAFENEEIAGYGKNLEIKHSYNLLENKSKELLNLLRADNSRSKGVRALRSIYENRNRAFPLSPAGLCDLFDIYAGQKIDTDTKTVAKNKQEQIHFANSPPDVYVEVKQRGNETVVVLGNADDLEFFAGERFGYILSGAVLNRCCIDYYNVLLYLVKAFSAANGRELMFVNTDKRRLAAFLLPELRRLGMLKEDTKEEYLHEKLAPRVYLDAESGIVTCKPVFVYNGTETEPGKKTDILRDFAGEYAFMKTLEMMGFSGEGNNLILADDDAIHNFYYEEGGLEKLRGMAEVFATDAFTNISRRTVKPPAFGLRINGNLLEVQVSGDYSPDELMQALESYRLKKTYHKLTDGRFVNFDGSENVYGKLDELFSGLDLQQKDIDKDIITVPRYRAMYVSKQLEGLGTELALDDGVKKLLDDFTASENVDFTVPASLDNILRPYQKEGFRWLMTLSRYGFGGILADDMGLGKTIQVIAAILSYKESTETSDKLPSIVIAPTSLVYNWEKEIARFAPTLKTALISGAAAKRREDFSHSENVDVYITTYDMLKRDIDFYADTVFRFVVADEAQNIKNPGTQNAKSIKRLKARVRFALTGTPIENALSELWSMFNFIMPGYLFGAAKYTKTYESPILKDKCDKAAQGLRRQISPFILRRLKADVLTELPEKVETTLYADMTDEQKLVYDAYLLKTKQELDETVRLGRVNESRIEILSMLTRLRQICCHPSTFIENYAGGSGKLDLTIETLASVLAAGHRVLIFSQFTRMLAILTERLDSRKIKYFYLDGATPSKERLEMTEKFNGGERDAFLISLKAGGAGLNLTGADVVMHYDPWWNPAVMAQASDRAHRFGQSRMVQVFNIVSKDSIEEKIIALQNMKKNLVDSIIEGTGANFVNKLTQDEIIELFGGIG